MSFFRNACRARSMRCRFSFMPSVPKNAVLKCFYQKQDTIPALHKRGSHPGDELLAAFGHLSCMRTCDADEPSLNIFSFDLLAKRQQFSSNLLICVEYILF